MSKSIIMIQNEMKLKLELDNIAIYCEKEKATYPIGNLESIILDNMNSSISGRLLSKLGESNVTIIATDKKHLPIGIFIPYSKHCRSTKILQSQISFLENSKELWTNIIKTKIENQAKTIEILDLDLKIRDDLLKLRDDVKDGDITNRESFAAKIYFNELMQCSFSRGNDEIVLNGALNYAYAIVRSTIAKIGIAYGLNMQLGIHHKNEYNEFNLADDLIEPFRPIVDLYTYKLMEGEEFFSSSHRKDLVTLLYKKILYGGRNIDIEKAIDEYLCAYSTLIRGINDKIEYPLVENVEFAKSNYIFEHYIDDYIFNEDVEDEI